MSIHTSIFHPSSDTDSDADSMGRILDTDANTPASVDAQVGRGAKSPGIASAYSRYFMKNPVSGDPIPLNGRIYVRRAKITFGIHTTAVIQGQTGVCRVGVMAFTGSWTFGALAFGTSAYADREDFPHPADNSDNIVSGILYNDAFLTTTTEDKIFYFPATFAAGTLVTIGDGYVFSGSNPPGEFNGYSDLFRNFASELTTYFRQETFRNSSLAEPSLALVINGQDQPANLDEFFHIHTRDSPGFDGVVLEIEWDDLRSSVRATAKISSERVFAAKQIGPRVKPVKADAKMRVRAPQSNLRNRE